MYFVGDCKSEDEMFTCSFGVKDRLIIIVACQPTWYAFSLASSLSRKRRNAFIAARSRNKQNDESAVLICSTLCLFFLRRNIFQRLEPVADTSNTREESHSHHSTMSRGTRLEASRLELESLSQSYRYRYQW